MKNFFLAGLVMCSAVACAPHNGVKSSEFSKLAWLEGHWVRTGTKPNQAAFEVWQKTASGEYSGKGVSMQGSDTSFVEKLRIVQKEGGIFYVADVPENPEPVYFRFTEVTDTGFVCENPDHDFPKKICYTLADGQLKATISGSGEEIEFNFSRDQTTRRN